MDRNDRWQITDIEVPFKCVVFWMLKMLGAYVMIGILLAATGALLFAIFTALLAALGAGHGSTIPTHIHF
jgi:hypothetical protein